jgi:hypothetical protein
MSKPVRSRGMEGVAPTSEDVDALICEYVWTLCMYACTQEYVHISVHACV